MERNGGVMVESYGEINSVIDRDLDSDDDLHAPLLDKRQGNVSNTRTLMNLLRGMIGSGCLALPVAFKQAGLWTGFGLVFLIGFLNIHCMYMLVRSAQYLCQKSGKLELDYGHLTKKAFDFGPEKWRPHSKKALYVTNAVVAAYQLGVCAVLFVFMAAHIKQVFESIEPGKSYVVSVRIYLCIILIPVVLINFIRQLKVLALFSTVGNFLMVVAFLIIFQQLIRPPNEISHLPSFTDFGSLILGLGSILYAFEGQAMILPMENKMKRPGDMLGFTGVLNTGMSVVICIYAATGWFGYASYGEAVKGSIVLNLPENTLFDIVRGLLVLIVYAGYPLQLYVVIEMFWGAVKRKCLYNHQRIHLPLEYAFRTALVFFTFVLGVAIPKLEDIIPLVGVTAGMMIAFVFPPFIETVTFWEEWKLHSTPLILGFRLAKNVLLISIGIFGLVAGLYATISQLLGKT